jgi:hypothetical protein
MSKNWTDEMERSHAELVWICVRGLSESDCRVFNRAQHRQHRFCAQHIQIPLEEAFWEDQPVKVTAAFLLARQVFGASADPGDISKPGEGNGDTSEGRLRRHATLLQLAETLLQAGIITPKDMGL